MLSSFALQATGSANRITRLILLDTLPSLDVGEVTDKGSINQRAVLDHRQALVDDLYAVEPSDNVLIATARIAHVA